METSVGIEDMRENILSPALSLERTDHPLCPWSICEGVSELGVLQFVICIFVKPESWVHNTSGRGRKEEYCHKISQRHEGSLILSKVPGLEILRYGLTKSSFMFAVASYEKPQRNFLDNSFLTQYSGLNLKEHIHSVPWETRKGFESLNPHFFFQRPYSDHCEFSRNKGSLQGEVISRRKTLVTGPLLWNFGLKSLCFMWLWDVFGTFSQWISYGEKFGNISKSLTNVYNT